MSVGQTKLLVHHKFTPFETDSPTVQSNRSANPFLSPAPPSMLSASNGRDSCQRISADSSKANSVNFRNKAECAAVIFFISASSVQENLRFLCALLFKNPVPPYFAVESSFAARNRRTAPTLQQLSQGPTRIRNTCHGRRSCHIVTVTSEARVVKWQTRQT